MLPPLKSRHYRIIVPAAQGNETTGGIGGFIAPGNTSLREGRWLELAFLFFLHHGHAKKGGASENNKEDDCAKREENGVRHLFALLA
jgi:hypothetical protein